MSNIKTDLAAILLLLSSSASAADFKIDLDLKEINTVFEVFTLGDLGVGDSGYVHRSTFCVENGTLKIPKDLQLENDRSEYGSFFKVKRLPSDSISVELVPPKSDSKKEGVISFIKTLGNKQAALKCELLYSLFGYSKSDLFVVSTVEGAESLKGLLRTVRP